MENKLTNEKIEKTEENNKLSDNEIETVAGGVNMCVYKCPHCGASPDKTVFLEKKPSVGGIPGHIVCIFRCNQCGRTFINYR